MKLRCNICEMRADGARVGDPCAAPHCSGELEEYIPDLRVMYDDEGLKIG